MGPNRLFFKQEFLDRLLVEEKVHIDGDVMALADEPNRYRVMPALYFVADVADGHDPFRFVGRVKATHAVVEMGGEHYHDSVVIGDTAYSVQPGFVGEPLEIEEPVASELSQVATTGTEQGRVAEDRELLARFLLDNL